ncbi:hypothetical protein ACQV2W_03625 [Facklamia sp. P12934]|uniref:hypothetical protein n=1 Tax=unclassified Facklamia TaxID=2622293 RepID=UPI003D167EC2
MKDFTANNPAEAFIRGNRNKQAPASKIGRPKSTEETKSKRTNLLLYPSIFEDLRKIAYIQQTSINDIMNDLGREFTLKHQEDIIKYDKFFKKGT